MAYTNFSRVQETPRSSPSIDRHYPETFAPNAFSRKYSGESRYLDKTPDNTYWNDKKHAYFDEPSSSTISLEPWEARGVANELGDPNVVTERRNKSAFDRRSYQREEQGWFKGKITWCSYILSVIQLIIFIVEIGINIKLTGIPIQIQPTFNPMIGPSSYVLIYTGARYQPCMHRMAGFDQTVNWACPNTTTVNLDTSTCTLAQLCGFNGAYIPEVFGQPGKPVPHQWFRFITPIFLHAGIIHIGFNLLLQLTLGRDMEIKIGSLRFFIVYISSGIFGFVLGGNFAANGIASTGASGSLFGVVALTLLDLLYNWQVKIKPWKELLYIMLDVVIAFVLGLLPGLDNFSHIGGFLMGLILGICLLRSPSSLRRHMGQDYHSQGAHHESHWMTDMIKSRGYSFNTLQSRFGPLKQRTPVYWIWLSIRVVLLAGVVTAFVVLLKNFYVWDHKCSWCKYLSCINVRNWCTQGTLEITTQNNTSPNPARRDMFLL